MEYNEIIKKTKDYVSQSLEGSEGGHDKWHAYRVWRTARHIAESEGADMLIVELSSLLHDIADSKFYRGDEEIGPRKAKDFLTSLDLEERIIRDVVSIISNISFKGGNSSPEYNSLELDVVQDADRLDAIGAIGIARTFNYGGYTGRLIHDPNVPVREGMTKEEYKDHNPPTINHFYEKLLLLKDRMNTSEGRKMAQERHEFMEGFLRRFYLEWEGEV